VINHVGITFPDLKSELVGQVGTPARGPWYANQWGVTCPSMVSQGFITTSLAWAAAAFYAVRRLP